MHVHGYEVIYKEVFIFCEFLFLFKDFWKSILFLKTLSKIPAYF